MSDLEKVKNWLRVRRLVLWLLIVLILFAGSAFVWKNVIVWAYDVWEPLLRSLYNLPLGVWLISGAAILIWKGLHYHFKESSSRKELVTDNAVSFSDAPIQKASDDLFARSSVV